MIQPHSMNHSNVYTLILVLILIIVLALIRRAKSREIGSSRPSEPIDSRGKIIVKTETKTYKSIDEIQDSEIRNKAELALKDALAGKSRDRIRLNQQFTVNGVTYDSPDQVPEPERSKIKEAIENQSPPSFVIEKINNKMHFIVNGATYDNPDDIPDPKLAKLVREILEKKRNS